jgi:hypothetical protein
MKKINKLNIIILFLGIWIYSFKDKGLRTNIGVWKNDSAFLALIVVTSMMINDKLKAIGKIKKNQIFIPALINALLTASIMLTYMIITGETHMSTLIVYTLLILGIYLIYIIFRTMEP